MRTHGTTAWLLSFHLNRKLTRCIGILGCAPSAEVLATWNKREGELIAANKLDRIVAQPPNSENVHAGSGSEDIKAKVGKEGARTIPGKQLSYSSSVHSALLPLSENYVIQC